MKCNLSRMLGEKRLKISNVVEDTGINRGTLTRLYHENAQRIELEVLDKLCCYLNCSISDLLEPTFKRQVDEEGNVKCQTFQNEGDVVWEKEFIKPITEKNK